MEFVIARNPDEDSSLPYLVRLPLGPAGVVLKVRDTWPRTSKIYCHESTDWPAEPQIVERVPARSCVRRGASIDLVLERGKENRSQFVFANARGRQVIFWQSARTSKQAKPVTLPTKRAQGLELQIVVDTHERYAWNFSHQQVTIVKRALPAGDYGVMAADRLVATVERKSLADFVSTLNSGKLRYLLADLASVPRAAVVIEDRMSSVFKLSFVRPSVVAEGLAEAQVRFPTVPIMFCESRQLAQEWTYRFLAAAAAHHGEHEHGALIEGRLPSAPTLAPLEPTVAEVRRWAVGAGIEVPPRGRLRPEVWAMFRAARLPSAEASVPGTPAVESSGRRSPIGRGAGELR